MAEVRVGDLFRDVRAPNRRWRVAGGANGVFELASIDKPGLSRFQTTAKLLDRQLYAPEPSDAPQAAEPGQDACLVRKVLIVLRGGRSDGAGKLGAAIASALSADVRLVLVEDLPHEAPFPDSAAELDRNNALTAARKGLGLGPATPAAWEHGPAATAVVSAAAAWSADLVVLGGGDLALAEGVLRSAGRAVLVAP